MAVVSETPTQISIILAHVIGRWHTLTELRQLTGFRDSSISAQLRNMRKLEGGAHKVDKRIRATHRNQIVWEYTVNKENV